MLLVTDVTGPVGRAVVAELANGPAAVRVLLQPGAELPQQAPNIEGVHVEPADPGSLQRAMQGVEAIFLSWQFSPHLAESHMRIVTAAKAAGVRRLVQQSGVGADPNMCCARMLRWYGQAEVTVAAAGLEVTRLRPSNLMQNLFEFAPSIAQQGVISGPFRATKWTWVDARDVGAVAAVVLRDATHSGRTYTITGSESMSYPQIAEHMTRILGKPVRYTDITANEARGWLQGKGLSPVMIEAKLELWDACASNLINTPPTQVVKEVTGREPRTLDEFLQDHRQQFLTAHAA